MHRGLWHARTDRAVIRICHEDFWSGTHDGAGRHGNAERGARGVTLFLQPGLTAAQRRAVIRRLRQEASRGFGPPLPVGALALALAVDRVRAVARGARAIVRLHPVVTLVPGALVIAVTAAFILASSAGPGGAPRARALLIRAVPVARAVPAGEGDLTSLLSRPGPAGPAWRSACLPGGELVAGATADRPPVCPVGLGAVEGGVGVRDQGRGPGRARRALGDAGAG